MAKPRGRKPAKDSKLPDPKVWKWCKHPECLKKAQQLEGFGEENEQELMRVYPGFCAVFFEDYCWKHLSLKARDAYKEKIEAWVAKGRSLGSANLKKAILYRANLQGAKLSLANLQNASLGEANLQGADLLYADLQKADLEAANLQEARLWSANLQGADLWVANLQEALLFEANLQEARLWSVNLQKANFGGSKLHGCYLHGVLLDDARYLTWQQIEYTGEEKDKKWLDAQDAYRRLKNYFHQQGLYQDESNAYYREKLMAKHLAHEELFGRRRCRVPLKTAKKSWKRLYVWFLRGIKRALQNIGRFFAHNKHKGVRRRWFGLWFMWALAGFGERWSRTICWAAGTFAFFGLLHWLGTNLGAWVLKTHGGEVKSLLDCLYFSLVTFVTLGFGDIWPATWLPKIIVGFEVVFGYVFLGLLVTLIARKMGR